MDKVTEICAVFESEEKSKAGGEGPFKDIANKYEEKKDDSKQKPKEE